MIKTFKCKETEKIWNGEMSLQFPRDIQSVARRKLRMMHNAKNFMDLSVPPNNRLEALKGNRSGEFSIRINIQWRICFEWLDGYAENIIIEDYH